MEHPIIIKMNGTFKSEEARQVAITMVEAQLGPDLNVVLFDDSTEIIAIPDNYKGTVLTVPDRRMLIAYMIQLTAKAGLYWLGGSALIYLAVNLLGSM